MVLKFFTGLAFFLFGMERLSSLLTKIAKSDFSERLNKRAKSSVSKIVAGFIVKALFQSGGATTSVFVSLSSVGILSVEAALNFLIGANLGSISAAWIVAFKITRCGAPLFVCGILGNILFKKGALKNFSLFFIGLGLIFFGLDTISQSFAFLKDSPKIIALLKMFDAADSISSLLLLTLFGVLFTALSTSSAAAIAIVLSLVLSNSLSLYSGAAIILGSTLGSTITAFLAAIGASEEGKQTAFLQIFVNFIELLLGLLLFYPSVEFVQQISGLIGYDNPTFVLSLYLTFLKFLLLIAILPFRKPSLKLAERVIPRRFILITDFVVLPKVLDDAKNETALKLFAPSIEICAKYLTSMLSYSYIGIRKPAWRSLYKKIVRYEEIIDKIQRQIVSLISRTPLENYDIFWVFLKTADEIESMGDHAKSIGKYSLKFNEKRDKLDDAQRKMILDVYLKVFLQFNEVCLKRNYRDELVVKSETIEREIRRYKRKIYLELCRKSNRNYEKRLILLDILAEYSKFNHSIKRILQVNLDFIYGRGVYLWEKN